MTTPILQNEKKRLKILWQYESARHGPEEVFDDLTELAARSAKRHCTDFMVDEKRQWFKSKFGTDVTETSRDISFCAYAITQPGLSLCRTQPWTNVFADNPLVTVRTGDPLLRWRTAHHARRLCPGDFVCDRQSPTRVTPGTEAGAEHSSHHVVSQLELRRRSRN